MNIEDFLPKYPNIHESKYKELNSYDNFYESIFKKKEFYENKLDGNEKFPKEKGQYTKYQKTLINYMSSYSPYDKVLIIHDPGLGKTCSVIGAIEKIKQETNIYNRALIFAKGEILLENFKKELVYSCTDGRYYPDNYKDLTEMEIIRRINKKTNFYDFKTFAKFAKKLKNTRDQLIIDNYSNKIIVIDEVHNLRIHHEKEEALEIYQQFHRFLHLVKNCKIMLLSGTPFKDSIEEVPSIANLLLNMDEQLPTGNNFKEQYTEKKGNVYTIKEEKKREIKEKLKGKISFLRENQSSDIEKKFIGEEEKKFGGLNHLVVNPVYMSEFQSENYFKALENDSSGNKGIFNSSKEATLFIFPDGSYGSEGFSKYIEKNEKNYKLKDELKNKLKGKNDVETLKNIGNYSAIYASTIKNILDTDGNCFVYSSVVNGSGCILFGLLLELFGFSKSKGKESQQALRYAILTNETGGKETFSAINKTFNSQENVSGKLIKVIIGSKVVSEGYSFFNVLFECILTPHWNYSEIAQALARGIRMGSHSKYIEKYKKIPIVKISQPVSIPIKTDKIFKLGKYNSLDLYMYKISEDKDISIRGVLRLLMESAFDCGLNYMRNKTKNLKDNSRECDYTTCDYKCDNIDMKYIKEGLDDSEIDYSTYFLYYSNPKISQIKKKIELLFRENPKLENSEIQKILLKNFNQEEIDISLELIKRITEQDENGKIVFNYKNFLKLYSTSNVKKIMNEIEELFKHNFLLNIEFILEKFSKYQRFEIITALRNLINDNIKIINKYGLPSYLREEKNIYFLVDSLTINSDFFINYYTRNIHIKTEKTFENIYERMNMKIIPKIIKTITTTKDNNQLRKLIKDLPLEIQEIFIEACIVAEEQNIKKASENRKQILYFYGGYIKNINNKWVSLLLQDNNISRCKNKDEDYYYWKDCDKNIHQEIEMSQKNRMEKIKHGTKHNILGTKNPQTNAFCILDFGEEEKKKRNTEDKRLNYTGKVCSAGGWTIEQLIDVVVNRLELDCPEKDYRKDDTIQQLITDIKDDKYAVKFLNNPEKNKDKNYLRRVLYWASKNSKNNTKGGVRSIASLCNIIEQHLEENGLVEYDNLCGIQGKKIIKKEEKTVNSFSAIQLTDNTKITKNNFRLALGTYFENDEIDKNLQDVKKTGICYIVNKRKNFVGLIKFKDNKMQELDYVAFLPKFRSSESVKDIIKYCFRDIYGEKSKDVSVKLQKLYSKYQINIDLYKNFGFEVFEDRDQYTIMKYKYENF